MSEKTDIVTLTRAEYEALIERIEDAEDNAFLNQVEAPTVEALRALRPAVFSGASAVIVVGSGMFWNYRQYIVSLVNKAVCQPSTPSENMPTMAA